MKVLIVEISMNLKTLSITLLSYVLWLVSGIIVIIVATAPHLPESNPHILPLVMQYAALIFYMLYVIFKLFQQWRTHTVVMGDNKILLLGSFLIFGTSWSLGGMIFVPSGYYTMHYVQYLSGTLISLTLLVLTIISAYRLKKTASAGQPSEITQKMLITTLACYIAWLIFDFMVISIVVSEMSFSTNATPGTIVMLGIMVFYGIAVASFLRKQHRSGMPAIHENNEVIWGAVLFVITPLISLLVASFIGYDLEWSFFVTQSYLTFSAGGVIILLYNLFMIKKIKKHSGVVHQAVEIQPAVVMRDQEGAQRRQAEEKARKQADLDAKKKADTEAKQRQKAEAEAKQKAKDAARSKAEEEKTKRKAEMEARKKAEADDKLRRKAEQDAQKKAEYEAEMRRRAEAEAKAKADAEAKLRAEEDAKMKKLQQLVKVSDRLSVARMAQLLEMPAEEVWKHVPDWAEKFNFRIAGEELVFNKENMDDFIASLDKEFRKWGKDGKV